MNHSDPEFTSVWDALEKASAEAENMRIRSGLMMAIRDFIESNGMSQAEAAKILDVMQPRISELQRGKIDLFSVDRLINMMAQAGLHVEVRVGKAA